MDKGLGPSSRAVHAGVDRKETGEPVTGPIVQSTTFVTDPEGKGELLYTRYGNNPTQRRVEARIAALENAEECVLTSSGMGAMAAALLAVLEAGDHVVAAEALYGGTRLFLERELSRLGISSTFADLNGSDWPSAIQPNTRAILAELPANPLLRVPDPQAISAIARERGLPLLIDVTFATPMNFRGLEAGADLVIHSATKYFGGHSDVTAGAVCGSADLIDAVRDRSKMFGTALDPNAAWLLERGIKTLALRMERQNANGLAVAEWAASNPDITHVHYPGLPSHPDHEIASRVLDGFGGMIGLEVQGGSRRATEMVRAFELITSASSLGGVESLVSEPRLSSHAHLSPEQRTELGIRDGFLRISLGIEDVQDIIGDLQQALNSTAALGLDAVAVSHS